MHLFFKATPLQSLAVYSAYDLQKTYIPDLIKSLPYKQKSPTHIMVDYEQDLPWPLSNALYKTGNIIEKVPTKSYKISWYQIISNSTENADGYAVFRPLKKGTWFTYVGHSEPKSFFAGLLKDIAPKQLQKTLLRIKEETETYVKERPNKLQKLVERTQQALKGQFIYKTKDRPHATPL